MTIGKIVDASWFRNWRILSLALTFILPELYTFIMEYEKCKKQIGDFC